MPSERPESLPTFVVFHFIHIYIWYAARHTLSVGFAEKSYKSFQIFQILFFIITYLFDLFRFVRFTRLTAHQHVCPQDTLFQSASPRNLTNLSKSSKSFFIIIYLFDLFRFVRFLCREAHSLPVGFAEKSHKSFQIFQILFFIITYLFDLFRCFPNIGSEASVARRTPDEKTGLIFPQR